MVLLEGGIYNHNFRHVFVATNQEHLPLKLQCFNQVNAILIAKPGTPNFLKLPLSKKRACVCTYVCVSAPKLGH